MARKNWHNKFLDAQSEIFSCVRAMQPVAREIEQKVRGNLSDSSWNNDYHVELTLTIGECRMIQDLVNRLAIPSESEAAGVV